MMKNYSIRQYSRQDYTSVSVQFLLSDAQAISEQAKKHNLPRHTLLTRAIKIGLPQVLAQLEAKAARSAAQTKQGL